MKKIAHGVFIGFAGIAGAFCGFITSFVVFFLIVAIFYAFPHALFAGTEPDIEKILYSTPAWIIYAISMLAGALNATSATLDKLKEKSFPGT